jgi:hypothetical protein
MVCPIPVVFFLISTFFYYSWRKIFTLIKLRLTIVYIRFNQIFMRSTILGIYEIRY